MKRLENSIEQSALDRVRRVHGVIGIKLVTPSDDGWPDRMFIIPGGRPLLVEFKRPGEEPRPKQVEVHRQLRRLGYDVETVDNTADCLDVVAAAIQRARATLDPRWGPAQGHEIPAGASERRPVRRPRSR